MLPIGRISQPPDIHNTLACGHSHAHHITDCLVEARRVANIVIAGWHGRQKRGVGDNFWQFRQFADGENAAQIDWRRSARDEYLYIRDKEWKTAHTVWLWVDLSPSMKFQSKLSSVSKQERAFVILLALAEILSRSGERIGIPGMMKPVLTRNGAEKLAQTLKLAQDKNQLKNLPSDFLSVQKLNDIILISDFLDKGEKIIENITPIAKHGTRGHLIEISDPAEEIFPYSGRIEFHDPETGKHLMADKASTYTKDYTAAYQNRRTAISTQTRRLGWNFVHHRTDRPVSETLLTIHGFLSGITHHLSGKDIK